MKVAYLFLKIFFFRPPDTPLLFADTKKARGWISLGIWRNWHPTQKSFCPIVLEILLHVNASPFSGILVSSKILKKGRNWLTEHFDWTGKRGKAYSSIVVFLYLFVPMFPLLDFMRRLNLELGINIVFFTSSFFRTTGCLSSPLLNCMVANLLEQIIIKMPKIKSLTFFLFQVMIYWLFREIATRHLMLN